MILQKPFKTICTGVWAGAVLLLSLNTVLMGSPTSRVQVSLTDVTPTLAVNPPTNGQVQVALTGQPSIAYTLQSSPDLMNWAAVATNSDNTTNRYFALPATAAQNYFRAFYNLNLRPHLAIAALQNVTLNGNGLITDSWNSHDTNLSTGGQYDPAKTSTNGDVASVAGIVNLGNHIVSGNLYLGPNATNTGSGTVNGTVYTDANMTFPDVSLPPMTWPAAPFSGGIHTFTNGGYYQVTDSLPIVVKPGVAVAVSVTTSATYAPASIQIGGGMTNAGTLVLYLQCSTAILTGNSSDPCRPENLAYFGLPELTTLSWGGISGFVGTVYAPEATCHLNFGGNSGNFIGSCLVNTLIVNGHISFHFDEALVAP